MVVLLMGLRIGADEIPQSYQYEHDSWDDWMVQLCSMNEMQAEIEKLLQLDWLFERDGREDVSYCISLFSRQHIT